jgi:hypothetical protein
MGLIRNDSWFVDLTNTYSKCFLGIYGWVEKMKIRKNTNRCE